MVEVQNVHGTSKDRYARSKGGDPWLEYWEEHSKYIMPTYCSCEGCTNEVKVGAHVMKTSGSRKWFIVPLCHKCNQKEEPFNVDEDFLVELNM